MAHASQIFDYNQTVKVAVECHRETFIQVYSELLKRKEMLKIVEDEYSPSLRPWMFLSFAAHTLSDKKMTFVKPDVSLFFHYIPEFIL